MKNSSQCLHQPAYDDFGEDQDLAPLFPARGETPNLQEWDRQRHILRRKWDKILGRPAFGSYSKTERCVESFEQPEYKATVFQQRTGPEDSQLVVLLEPKLVTLSPRPGAVVPFYDPDRMIGYDLKKRDRILDAPSIQFGRHLVQQGYVVVCTEAFPYNTAPDPGTHTIAWWEAGARVLLSRNPQWTGMGKLISDTQRAVDLLLAQPDIDRDRIMMIGHSLGGKMAFLSGALDERVKAVIGSDFGIGWSFTNWDAPWYFGDQIHVPGFSLACHQVLALLAPRSFLLIGGEFDGPASWQYIEAARPVYRLYGRETALGFLDHASGHRPPKHAVATAYKWLAEQFGLARKPWQF